MKTSVSTPVRIMAILTLVAFTLTATVPHYCSTGWCCTKHSTEKVAQKPSCCASKTEVSVQTAQQEGSCCGSNAATNSCGDKQDRSGCATGCCKIAAGHFVFSPALAIAFLSPISTLDFDNPLNTGIELTDYIPQPPRALSA